MQNLDQELHEGTRPWCLIFLYTLVAPTMHLSIRDNDTQYYIATFLVWCIPCMPCRQTLRSLYSKRHLTGKKDLEYVIFAKSKRQTLSKKSRQSCLFSSTLYIFSHRSALSFIVLRTYSARNSTRGSLISRSSSITLLQWHSVNLYTFTNNAEFRHIL